MTLLVRYLARQNLFLIFTILLVGTGLYVLTDMFERLDTFIESGAGTLKVFIYFLLKIPTIISLILPAVYLLALVVQLNMLDRSRELIALTAGGVSPSALMRFIFVYGLLWALLQLAFAQFIGVAGESRATRIWQEDVRGNMLDEASIKGLWFTEKNQIIHIGEAFPVQKKGTDLLVYTLDDTGVAITEIIKAKSYAIDDDGNWLLRDGGRLVPSEYSATPFQTYSLSLKQDLRVFQVGAKSSGIRPSHLSLGQLAETIARLEEAGSNVERLQTAWHGKFAYAFSIFIMGLLAYIVSRQTANIYAAVVLSLLVVFFYYTLNTMCTTLGEKGILSPLVGAWFANVFFLLTGLTWVFHPNMARLLRKLR